MIEYLNTVDTKLFLFLNGFHNPFFDVIMYGFSDKLIWIPMYLLLAFWLVWRYQMQGVIMLIMAGLVIVFCDQTASHLIKSLVHRLRPSHEAALAGLIHISRAGPGGLYGFVSSHAANSFGLASFFYFMFEQKFRLLKYWILIWAVLVSYSRIYNGVHYPGDVIGGAVIGACMGWGMSKIYQYIEHKYIMTYV